MGARGARGFTLIELLVVLVIIGCLVGLAVFSTGIAGPSRELNNEAERLAGLTETPAAPLAGRVGWRLIAPDRLPLIGGLAAPNTPLADQLRLQPRRAGLVVCTGFASRGITWAALAGRLVAALALGSPRPLEAELLDAVDPLRFALRRQRKAPR